MATSQTAARERVVLIVDDEEANRQLFSALLSAQGYTTKLACDGPSALKQVKAGGIDLMLLDVMMPGMDGVEACQRIRKELGMLDLTIVFVTALSDRESRMHAKLAGADDFLVKPVDSFELTFRVANWMKLRSLRDLELHTIELARRLDDAAIGASAAAYRLHALAEQIGPSRSSPVDGEGRAQLFRELTSAAAELRALSESAERPLLTRPSAVTAKSLEARTNVRESRVEARMCAREPELEARLCAREPGTDLYAAPLSTRNQRT